MPLAYYRTYSTDPIRQIASFRLVIADNIYIFSEFPAFLPDLVREAPYPTANNLGFGWTVCFIRKSFYCRWISLLELVVKRLHRRYARAMIFIAEICMICSFLHVHTKSFPVNISPRWKGIQTSTRRDRGVRVHIKVQNFAPRFCERECNGSSGVTIVFDGQSMSLLLLLILQLRWKLGTHKGA